jgi:Zn/Cd-binding protein ZinT
MGLKTSYRDFYEYYLKQPSSGNPSIERFKTELKSGLSKNIELWSDMELALGKYTANLSSKNELVSVYDDVWDNLQEYISSIDTDSVLTPKAKEKFKNSIIKPTTFLAQRYKSLIENKIRNKDSGLEISILNFN